MNIAERTIQAANLIGTAIKEAVNKKSPDEILRQAFARLSPSEVPSKGAELRTDDIGHSYERANVRSSVAYFGGVEEDFLFSDDPIVADLIDEYNLLVNGEVLKTDD